MRAMSNPSGSPLSSTYSKGGNSAFVPTVNIPSANAAVPSASVSASVSVFTSTSISEPDCVSSSPAAFVVSLFPQAVSRLIVITAASNNANDFFIILLLLVHKYASVL